MKRKIQELFMFHPTLDNGKISTGRKLIKLAEECSELSATICGSFFKNKDVTDDVFSEMADVYIVFSSLFDKMSKEAKQRLFDKISEKNEKFDNQLTFCTYPDIVIKNLDWL